MSEHEQDQAPAITPEPGTYTSHLAGANFYKGAKERWAGLPDGKVLTLEREPTNEYDKFAVKVIDPTDNMQLGHVPRYLAPRVSEALKPGSGFYATCLKQGKALRTSIVTMAPPKEGQPAPDPDLEVA